MTEKWTAEDIPDLSGKVVIVTGANSGIGLEASRELARKGAEVVMACRTQDKAEAAVQQIQEDIPQAKLEYIHLDLADLTSVNKFAADFKSRYEQLDVLLNNAGIMMVPYKKTADGFESQFGTNHLGHFALTGSLIDLILKTPGARVVNISSNAHYGGEIDFDNLQYEDGGYNPSAAYSRSKLANLLFTYELQRRFEGRGAEALALAAHPGIAATGLADHFLTGKLSWLIQGIMKVLFQSAKMGSLPGLRAATDPQAEGGSYYGPGGKGERSGYPVVVTSNQASHNQQDAARLWKVSEDLTGVSFLSD
jgi:NAD(P)-dependent dehydrogenase (short-subunit alcohol dehydrogenase family)